MTIAQFDQYELNMLDILQRDGRRPVSDLASDIGLSATPCARRFDGLIKSGIISRFIARLDRRQIGLGIEIFIQVSLTSHNDGTPENFIEQVQTLDAVTGCWAMTGDQDFLLHVLLPDIEALDFFVMGTLLKINGVRDVRTNVVLNNIKGPGPLPLGHLAAR